MRAPSGTRFGMSESSGTESDVPPTSQVKLSPQRWAGKKFIGGLPRNPATNMFAGSWYRS